VPDILCLKSGIRIESRAKTKLEISMSHSPSNQNRGWDSGLSDDDWIAFPKCDKVGESPTDWKASDNVQFFTVLSLREAFKKKQVIQEAAKGTQEGSEIRLTWPSAVANNDGVVTEIKGEKIKYKRKSDERIISIALRRRNIVLKPLVKVGDNIVSNQFIASVVEPVKSVELKTDIGSDFYIKKLDSLILSERFAAAKALRFLGDNKAIPKLINRVNDNKEHIYVRLEAAATLVKLGNEDKFEFLKQLLEDSYFENRLETVIVLSELKTQTSIGMLTNVIFNDSQPVEVRAGAAWALGEIKNSYVVSALIKAFDTQELRIKEDAAKALLKVGGKAVKNLLDALQNSREDIRAGAAWSLSRINELDIRDLSSKLQNTEIRKWVAWILGHKSRDEVENKLNGLKEKDPEVYFAATVLWTALNSWIVRLE
jgi:HEAT repeat protein